MSARPTPFRLEPIQVPRIWGRRWLFPLYEAAEELAEPIGEVWLSGEQCICCDGPFAGQTLARAWRAMPKPWRGDRLAHVEPFPLLAKFLFPDANLSVQVHPDDDFAARHEASAGGQGKTEMWYSVAAEPGAEARVGFEPGMDEASLRRALAHGTVEDCLRRIPIETGDAIFVPAGTVHTLGRGVVLCEIQQYSDLTYRLFDYDRRDASGKPRQLHVEKGLVVARFGASAAGKTKPVARNRGPVSVTYLAACPKFAVERWQFIQPAATRGSKDHFDILIFLDGAGDLLENEIVREYCRGEAWLVPASAGEYRLEPRAETTLLRAYVPELDALRRRLRAEGLAPEEIAGILFE